MTEAAPVVFVVDDDPSVRRAIQRLVESVGLQVELFGSAQEFLRSKRPDAPSCLVLDVRLPGISGLDFQRELADANIHIPIVFITAHGDIPMTVRAMKAGAVEFLTKPFRDQDLLDGLHSAQALSREFQSAYRDIHDLVLARSSAGKLARLLLSWTPPSANNNTKEIRVSSGLTHEEMAQMIGASRETVTRLLSDLRKKQLIRLEGSTLVIRNRMALEAMAA